ncbi:MAG: ATP-dependent zinc metalloprotease FtsH [Elusimicrobia bacterium]|nr:ATP-dependent zinc metalloprotease FtsH [Candidatus Obscuribacterium magneticum]
MNRNSSRSVFLWLIIFALVLFLIQSFKTLPVNQKLPYSEFKRLLKQGVIQDLRVSEDAIEGTYKAEGREQKFQTVPLPDPKLIEEMDQYGVRSYSGVQNRGWLTSIIGNIFYAAIFIFLWWFLFIRQMQNGGRQAMAFGRSRAKNQATKKGKVLFKDVAGVDEAKEELQEIIEFLKDPGKFQRLGGKIPKGVLLYGPPGTGKTLLAKAVAGEAGVPFFSASGSEFVEMFVGVGAARVRDLFEQGKKNAPCLLFVDELDAVGRHRFAGIGGGHDEREQTLNQILIELDGFESREGVILIAATNRPDVLDPALLRPGRFDRHIYVTPPDLKGREAILRVHVEKIKLAPTVDLSIIARRTPGFVGADLANVANEAALLAARNNRSAVEMQDMESAIDRVMAGPERKSRIISDREKQIVAYHESGHALVAKLTPGADPVHKVSIISRGLALGYTLQLPEQDRYLTSKSELFTRLLVLMGGRVAEQIVFGDITTGAQDDLTKATSLANRMVCEFGMSEAMGPVTYRKPEHEVFLGRDIASDRGYSEKTAQEIDKEVKDLLTKAFGHVKDLLSKNRDKLDAMAKALIEKEILTSEEVNRILGLPPSSKDAGA